MNKGQHIRASPDSHMHDMSAALNDHSGREVNRFFLLGCRLDQECWNVWRLNINTKPPVRGGSRDDATSHAGSEHLRCSNVDDDINGNVSVAGVIY
jgi:hypothetical protein